MDFGASVVKMLDLSTSHISESTGEWIMEEDTGAIVVYEKDRYGWFIVIPSEYQVNNKDEEFTDVPDDLKGIFDFALNQDCTWMMLDRDAFKEPKLPSYTYIW